MSGPWLTGDDHCRNRRGPSAITRGGVNTVEPSVELFGIGGRRRLRRQREVSINGTM